MKITSISTYFFPVLILIFVSATFSWQFFDHLFYRAGGDDDVIQYGLHFLTGTGFAALFYLLFLYQAKKLQWPFFKYLLVLLPVIINIIWQTVILKDGFGFEIAPVFQGLLLWYAYHLFDGHYTAKLDDEKIDYRNLLGQKGTILLTSITKLEQKKYLLSFFKEIKLLELTKKTGISFLDDERDEYEINIFTPAFKNKEIFEAIISKANKTGNLKIRQYET